MSATLTPNYTVGKAVALSLGGQTAYCTDGNIERTAAAVDVSNAKSGGFQQLKAGRKSASGSINCVFNGDDPPTGVVEGAELTLILDTVGYEVTEGLANVVAGTPSTPVGRLVTMQAFINSVNDQWNSGDSYTYSLTVSSTGPYTVSDAATGATAIT